jgi:F-type H+-transporting ATPase subunit alpha
VGGNAQIKAMKKVAGPLRLNLAQFRELEAFAEFGSELDAASQAQLERGRRVVEMLKQPQYEPVPVEEQVLSVYAVNEGFMDAVDMSDVRRFDQELRQYMQARHSGLMSHIVDTGELPDTDELNRAIAGFVETFQAE